ncbi:MAG: glycosyltransferase [Pseudohongiellaceae bacterium]|nr:glycosyltransferase [Pseudohongiellaceae bacterium]
MKVAHIIGNFDKDRGGAQKVVKSLCNLGVQNGFSHEVLHFFGNGSLKDELTSGVKCKSLSGSTAWDLRLFSRLAAALRSSEPDIVHVHSPIAGLYSRINATAMNIPIVSSVHSTSYPFLHRLAERGGIDRSRYVVAVSESAAQFAEFSLGVSKSKLCVIHNGVNLDEIKYSSNSVHRSDFGLNEADLVLCNIGRHTHAKGLDILIRTLPNILAVRADIKLLLVGSGDSTCDLVKLCEELGLSDKVIFAGARSDVYSILELADICVFPSRWEGFGLAAVEAVVKGKSVLVSDLPVFHEVLGDRVGYFQLSDQDVARSILSELNYIDGISSSEIVECKDRDEKFSDRYMVQAYEAVYCKAVALNRTRN